MPVSRYSCMTPTIDHDVSPPHPRFPHCPPYRHALCSALRTSPPASTNERPTCIPHLASCIISDASRIPHPQPAARSTHIAQAHYCCRLHSSTHPPIPQPAARRSKDMSQKPCIHPAVQYPPTCCTPCPYAYRMAGDSSSGFKTRCMHACMHTRPVICLSVEPSGPEYRVIIIVEFFE
jgi:hypothetical protein